MNFHAIKAIFMFEIARTRRTIMTSIAAPVLSTSLYFIVFGSAIGSRMTQIDGISYGSFIVPGLILLSTLTESISNASFGIYMPRFSGMIYEVLSAPISALDTSAGLRRRRVREIDLSGTRHSRDRPVFCPLHRPASGVHVFCSSC